MFAEREEEDQEWYKVGCFAKKTFTLEVLNEMNNRRRMGSIVNGSCVAAVVQHYVLDLAKLIYLIS